ncbi:MAG: hypothetical protein HUJ94_04390 [Bacteroidales bacterium]|nr:hypothetical protein [Bacteroidales bacterium]
MNILTGILVALLTVVNMDGGQFLEQIQKRDSVLIADQLRYGFTLKGVPAGTSLALQDWSQGLCEGVELVCPSWQMDTLKIHKKDNTVDLKAYLVITSFDEGEYELPALGLARRTPDGKLDTLMFETMKLEVKTLPVDTAAFDVATVELKPNIRYPLTLREILTSPWLYGALAFILAAVALAWWLGRRSKAAAAAAVKDPAHIVALRRLDRYRGDKYWAPEKQKAFYSGITDIMREYIAARFGISAVEMTTAEIFKALKKDKELTPELWEEMKELFERADFVKFAKFTADDKENAGVLPAAVRFVTMTYQEEVEKENVL